MLIERPDVKKYAIATLAATLVGFTVVPANAALTAAPAGDRVIYVMDATGGVISEFDRGTDTATVVCDTGLESADWITASAFDDVTGLAYWVRNASSDNATVVSVDLGTCATEEFPIDYAGRGSSLDIYVRSLMVDGGEFTFLVQDDGDWGNVWTTSVAIDNGVWALTPVTNFSNESQLTDIAMDPVTDQMYGITAGCQVLTLPDYTTVADYSGLASSWCPALEIDDNERIWFTSNYTGVLNSDDLTFPGADFQVQSAAQLDFGVFGEEFFFAPVPSNAAGSGEESQSRGGLASTGSNMNLAGVFGAAGLFFAAAIAFAVRARRLGRQ